MGVRVATIISKGSHAFIGYRSNMRSCRVVRGGNDRLRCETSLRFRFLGILLGLIFGLLGPAMIIRDAYGDLSGGLSFPTLLMIIGVAALGWFAFAQCCLFTRAIEIDASAGTIEFVRNGWRRSREVLPKSQISDAVVEKIVRLRSDAGDIPSNRIDCWLLRVFLKDGQDRVLCETTERSVVEELRTFISERLIVNVDTSQSTGQ
jgi:hypothetical protein